MPIILDKPCERCGEVGKWETYRGRDSRLTGWQLCPGCILARQAELDRREQEEKDFQAHARERGYIFNSWEARERAKERFLQRRARYDRKEP